MSAGCVTASFRLTLRQALGVLWTTIAGREVTLAIHSDHINHVKAPAPPTGASE